MKIKSANFMLYMTTGMSTAPTFESDAPAEQPVQCCCCMPQGML